MSNADDLAVLDELRQAYRSFVEFKRSSRESIRREYLELAEEKIRAEHERALHEFSTFLADMKDRQGLTVGQIQDEVLRTKSWRVWEVLRDAAGIPPERSPRAGAADKPGRKSGKTGDYEWNDDYTMLTVFHVPKVGVRAAADLPRPVVFVDWSTVDRVQVFTSDRVFRAIGEYRSRVIPFANDLVSAAVKEGLIPAGLEGRLMSSDASVVREHDAESDRLNAGWLD